ncbi:adenosylcobinamide-GDP ribazoletransferase [Pseudomonas duriflava]|nr:adenosylcobinamide-GDP ribazoletransferase [Pseudomonas duriflava]
MLPFLIALQFLTRIPVRLPGMPRPEQMGQSLLWYPAVGLLIGMLLWSIRELVEASSFLLQAALILAAWVLVTGALHLDGLADTADAWVGGFGDRERTLAIMKDPRSGPVGVVTIVVVLLLKFAALTALLESGQLGALVLAPWLARIALPAILLSTRYVRAGGLGQTLVDHMPRWRLGITLSAYGFVALFVLPGALSAVICAALIFWTLRRQFKRRLGGITGDTAGTLVELTECAILVTLALHA